MFSYIIYGLVWLVGFLPFRVLYLVADGMYYVLYYVVRYRRKVVAENLARSFPEKSLRERKDIERRFYRHLSDFFVEFFKPWHMSAKEIRKRCVFKHAEVLQRYYDQGRPVIGVMGHYGNWEWMTSYALLLNPAVSFYTLYTPLHNRVLDKMMLRIRSRFGAKPIPRNDVLRVILRDLQAKRVFLAAFIGDQTPNVYNLNFWTTFLNQDTPVLLGTEKIATKFNIPVISLTTRKVRRGYYEVEFVNLCENPGDLNPGALTELHTRYLEEQIRQYPEYWLWSHRRWKHHRKE